jgi:hypothetical protein
VLPLKAAVKAAVKVKVSVLDVKAIIKVFNQKYYAVLSKFVRVCAFVQEKRRADPTRLAPIRSQFTDHNYHNHSSVYEVPRATLITEITTRRERNHDDRRENCWVPLKTGTKTSLVVVEVLQKLSISGPVGLIHTLLARDSTAHILLTVRTVQLTHHHPSLAPPRLRKDRSRNSRRDRPIAAFLLSRSLS